MASRLCGRSESDLTRRHIRRSTIGIRPLPSRERMSKPHAVSDSLFVDAVGFVFAGAQPFDAAVDHDVVFEGPGELAAEVAAGGSAASDLYVEDGGEGAVAVGGAVFLLHAQEEQAGVLPAGEIQAPEQLRQGQRAAPPHAL